MSKHRSKRYDDDEQNVFDERGILKNGRAIKVPLLLMDSLGRAIAHEGELATASCTTHDAAGYEPGTRPGFVFSDAGRDQSHYESYRQTVTDAWKQRGDDGRLRGDAETRPEPPRSMTTDEAYQQYDADLANAWRGDKEVPEPRKNLTTGDAYLERNAYLENAWRGDGR